MFKLIPPIYLLALGLILSLIIGLFMNKQNAILQKAGDKTNYTAYNWKKKEAKDLINIWQKQPYTKAIKQIVYLDFFWMLVFGSFIFYGLWG